MRKPETLKSALAVSLAVHLLLLWPAAPLFRQGVTAQPLSVVLNPSKELSSGKLASATRSDRSVRAIASASEKAVVPTATEKALAAAGTENALVAAVTVPRTMPQLGTAQQRNTLGSTAESASRSESQATLSAPGLSQQVAPGIGGSQGLDADGVRQYRIALATEARRFKHYPTRALADEIGGTVEVRVAVAAGGQPQEVALVRSSGHGLLDEAALDMMRKAAPRTAVPELLRRRPFVINLPVVFDVASE
jgi:protein TonB